MGHSREVCWASRLPAARGQGSGDGADQDVRIGSGAGARRGVGRLGPWKRLESPESESRNRAGRRSGSREGRASGHRPIYPLGRGCQWRLDRARGYSTIRRMADECESTSQSSPLRHSMSSGWPMFAATLPCLLWRTRVVTRCRTQWRSRAGAADILSVYVGKGGGIGPARKIAAVAEAAGLTCTVGSNLELGVASAAMAHLATATPGSARRVSV